MLGLRAEALNTTARRGYFLPVFVGLVVFAWLALWLWEQSPYGRYLNHGLWTQYGLASDLCRVIPNGEVVLPAVLYIGGWMLMTTAMMLPAVLPLLLIFRRLTMRRKGHSTLLTLVITGYLVAWGVFGAVAHGTSWAILELVQGSVWLTFNSWIPGAIILLIAGAFQFSALKYSCLDKCRTPMLFINQYWQGHHARRQSLLLGIHHGIYCVGCCWALMLLMFAVGTGSVGWMLALGAVMAFEKNMPWGRKMSGPLGVLLLAWSGLIVWSNA